jgi:hypothetical protein
MMPKVPPVAVSRPSCSAFGGGASARRAAPAAFVLRGGLCSRVGAVFVLSFMKGRREPDDEAIR